MLEVLLKNLNKFGTDLKLFLEKRFELYRLETAEKISDIVSKSAVFVIIGGFILLLVQFILLAVAQILNVIIDFPAVGELSVALILLISTLTMYFNRQTIFTKIRKSILENLLIEENLSEKKQTEQISDQSQSLQDSGH